MNTEIGKSLFAGKINTMDALLDIMIRKQIYNNNNNRSCMPADWYRRMSVTRLFGGMDETNYWKYREELRLESGAYTNLNPECIPNCLRDRPYHGHFLHVAQTGDTSQVAFTENEDKGRRDVQLKMGYGKYLSRYYPVDLQNEHVKKYCEAFEYYHGKGAVVKFGETAEDFLKCIKDGPSESCMAGMDYKGHEHPAVIYAAGDIMAAWLERSGDVTARTLINKETKEFSRTYGDKLLTRLLEAQGYTQTNGALLGCKLLRIENEGSSGEYLMAYVDAGTGSGGGELHVEAIEDGKYWELVENDCGDFSTYVGYENNGLTGESGTDCADCGDCHDEDDMEYVENNGFVCESCRDNNYTHAVVNRYGDTGWVHSDNTIYVECRDQAYSDNLDLNAFDLRYIEDRSEFIEAADAVMAIDDEIQHIDDCVQVGTTGKCDEPMWILDSCMYKYADDLFEVEGEWVHRDSNEYEAAKEAADESEDPDEQVPHTMQEVSDARYPEFKARVMLQVMDVSLSSDHPLTIDSNVSDPLIRKVLTQMLKRDLEQEFGNSYLIVNLTNSIASNSNLYSNLYINTIAGLRKLFGAVPEVIEQAA